MQRSEHRQMDVGCIGTSASGTDGILCQPCEGQYDIDAVGRDTQCYKCGGFGHLANDCATPENKGKGKGGFTTKGVGKGDGKCFLCDQPGHMARDCPLKGKGKGKGWMAKGQGKGHSPTRFTGTCYICGKVGHRADQCFHSPNRRVNAVGYEAEGQDGQGGPEEVNTRVVEVGRVWRVGAVTAETPVKSMINRWESINKSAALTKDDEEWDNEDFPKLTDSEDDKSSRSEVNSSFGIKQIKMPKMPKKTKGEIEKFRIGTKSFEAPPGLEKRECWIRPVEREVGKVAMEFKFQVTDVNKPLASVRRICEQGNEVRFGPGKNDNYIENKESKDRIPLRPNGNGSYLMDVSFVGGGKTSIVVDSGAEDNVCPWEWGENFGIQNDGIPVTFKNASGTIMDHWGQRMVKVTSPF